MAEAMESQSVWILPRNSAIAAIAMTTRTPTRIAYSVVPWPSSSRSRENPGTVAVNPSIIPYRTLLYIDGYGYAVAEDTGGFVEWGGSQIDLFMNSESECRRWGVKRGVTVYVISE